MKYLLLIGVAMICILYYHTIEGLINDHYKIKIPIYVEFLENGNLSNSDTCLVEGTAATTGTGAVTTGTGAVTTGAVTTGATGATGTGATGAVTTGATGTGAATTGAATTGPVDPPQQVLGENCEAKFYIKIKDIKDKFTEKFQDTTYIHGDHKDEIQKLMRKPKAEYINSIREYLNNTHHILPRLLNDIFPIEQETAPPRNLSSTELDDRTYYIYIDIRINDYLRCFTNQLLDNINDKDDLNKLNNITFDILYNEDTHLLYADIFTLIKHIDPVKINKYQTIINNYKNTDNDGNNDGGNNDDDTLNATRSELQTLCDSIYSENVGCLNQYGVGLLRNNENLMPSISYNNYCSANTNHSICMNLDYEKCVNTT